MTRSEGPDSRDEEAQELEREADRSAILGVAVSRRTLAWTIAAVGIGAFGIIISVILAKGGGQQNITVNNDMRDLNDFRNSLPVDISPAQIRDEARRYVQ